MMMEMKQLLALLLLGCVFAHHEGENGAEQMDPCTQGIAAVHVFMEYKGCPGPNPYEGLRSLLRMLSNNMTVQNMNNLFNMLCRAAFPRIIQCFQRNIASCSLDQRNSLMRVVQETGLVCEPNTNKVNPVMKHLMSKLTDSDLAENDTCNDQLMSVVGPLCMNRTLEAIGINAINLPHVIKSLSMEQLAPIFQTFTRTMIGCMVGQTRNQLGSCPQWRGIAIRSIKDLILPPILGKNMPFTTAEIDHLFQWQSGGQAQENVEPESLLNLFK